METSFLPDLQSHASDTRVENKWTRKLASGTIIRMFVKTQTNSTCTNRMTRVPLPSSILLPYRCATTLRYSLLWYRHKDTRRHQGFVKESYFIFISLLISNMEYYKWRLHKLVKSRFLKNLHHFFVLYSLHSYRFLAKMFKEIYK